MSSNEFDLSDTIIPNSDQLNADDLLAHPVTVSITDVSKGNKEQPVNIHLTEFPGRPYRPGKSMRRVLVAAWGPKSSAYIGEQLTLYRDGDVTFGGQVVGGIRISHMSGLAKPLEVALTQTRGKKAMHVVRPLVERDWQAEADALGDLATLGDLWRAAPDSARGYIADRAAAIRAAAEEGEVEA